MKVIIQQFSLFCRVTQELEEDLAANLKNTEDMKFIWLVDKSDSTAIKTVEKFWKGKLF